MSKAAAKGGDAAPGKGGKKKLVILALPVVLAAAGAGLWFTGVIPAMLGKHGAEAHGAEASAPAAHGGGHGAPAKEAKGGKADGPVFAEVPEIVANLNAGARRTSFVKLRARLELSKPEDEKAVAAAMPRVLDLFTTYLREMRPDDLRGSAGTWRLREELTARASLAVAPARVRDVLFTELLVQ